MVKTVLRRDLESRVSRDVILHDVADLKLQWSCEHQIKFLFVVVVVSREGFSVALGPILEL